MGLLSVWQKMTFLSVLPVTVLASPGEDLHVTEPDSSFQKLPFLETVQPPATLYPSVTVDKLGVGLAYLFAALSLQNGMKTDVILEPHAVQPSESFVESMVQEVSKNIQELRKQGAACAKLAITYNTRLNSQTGSVLAPDRFMTLLNISLPVQSSDVVLSTNLSYYSTPDDQTAPPAWVQKSMQASDKTANVISSWAGGIENAALCRYAGISPPEPDI